MLVPEAPLDAYRSDIARNRSQEDFGGGDTVWLLTAHCLSRLSRASFEDLDLLGTQCASALRGFTDESDGGATLSESELADLCLVVDGFERARERAGAEKLARGIRGMARCMTEAGALSMAYSTIDLGRRVADRAPDRERGLLAADQAMVARLLGDLEAAEELYRQAESVGDRSGDFVVLARAYIGRGVIDRVRGNYPRSRIYFERGLELSESVNAQDLVRLANHGLMICHAIGKNFDRALQHGWTAYKLSVGQDAEEVESLSNLAQLSLDAGYPAAALRGYAAVVGRTTSARVALASLGGVAMAAAHTGDVAVLDRAAAAIESRVAVSALPYENAQALCQLAAAYGRIGLLEPSEGYRSAARKLAKARGFFEILHKTESEQVAKPVPVRDSASLSAPSRDVVASLSELDVGEAADMLCLTRSG